MPVKKFYLGFWWARVRQKEWRRQWRKRHKNGISVSALVTSLTIIIAFLNSYSSYTYQTIDDLQILQICASVPDTLGTIVNVTIAFENPKLPILLQWTIEAATNVSSIYGSLVTNIPTGKSIQYIIFELEGSYQSATINQVFSVAKYSAFPEPRTYSHSYPVSYPIHGYRILTDLARFLPSTIASLFFAQEGNLPVALCL